ncbi:prominin-2 [Girardinichthys multiradiatus]|uniref:prominin-2 n=1 Tax=Girardinichthys multiradiatus TaxID=208333 RepID=UPI001FAB4A1E|nr:prominin-2 [Girardinichthys multiradiatus]XP_047208102.1 prominin-2 [Girardinichthys multiradiatus]
MRLRGYMWRWPYRPAEGVMLLLGLSLARSVSAQLTCQAAEAAQNLTQPQYNNTPNKNTNADFLMPFVQSFLYTVQPHPFPEDLILKIVKDPQQGLSNQDQMTEILMYEVGFLVCIAIGILYIVLMPIIGFFVACCRCCGNCGGKMYQKQTSSIHCLRRTLYFSVFAITIIIFAGNICMFRSNQALKVSVNQSPLELHNALDDMRTFLKAVPQQVENVVNESYRIVQEVTRNLDDIGRQLGMKVQQRFRGTVDPALQLVRHLHQESLNTSDRLDKLNSSLVQLQSSIDRIQANVTAVRDQINQTLSKPGCTGCQNLTKDVQKLTVDTTISFPSLHDFQSALDEVIKADLQSKISEAEEFFRTIPQRVTNETNDLVQNSIKQLNYIKAQISQVSSELHLSALNDMSRNLDQVQSDIDTYLSKVESADDIRWRVGVALCFVVLLVVACNILGLVLGPLGLSPKEDPTRRSCTSDCGGIFLMMGAGFSILFSWLFMIVVLLLFLLGGNMYTLICRPWNNGLLLQFLDTPGLIPQLELGPALGLKTNIKISDIYRDCEKNQPLWTTLHLHELVNLGDILNVSKYTAQIREEFEKTNVTLSSVNLLSPEIKNQLVNISAKATNFNSTAVIQQMNAMSSINLNTTADKIEILSQQQPIAIKDELQNEALKLRQIQADIEVTVFPQVKNLNSSIKSLQSTTEKINGTVGEVLSKVAAAQDFLNTNTTQIVKTESRRFLDCQVDYFTAYADWATIMVTQQVGRCKPVARAVDSFEVVLCVNMVESLNAFWFSLGWCLMFFIPSTIFSIKLAKYYRRMKYSDCFDNHIVMNHIPRAQIKIT